MCVRVLVEQTLQKTTVEGGCLAIAHERLRHDTSVKHQLCSRLPYS